MNIESLLSWTRMIAFFGIYILFLAQGFLR